MPTRRRLTFYDVLGLPMDASLSDIDRAYRRRLVQCHQATRRPHDNDSCCRFLSDKEAEQSVLAVKVLQKAHTVLSHPRLRAWYDEQLLGRETAARAAMARRQAKQAQREVLGRSSAESGNASKVSLTEALAIQRPQAQMIGSELTAAAAAGKESAGEAIPVDGVVRVMSGTEVDPTSGAVVTYKTVAYATTDTVPPAGPAESAATTTTEHDKDIISTHSARPKTESPSLTSPASQPATPPSDSGTAATPSPPTTPPPLPAPTATALPTTAQARQPLHTPLLQDFDPALLALLPGRMQVLLGQLLSAPLPPVAAVAGGGPVDVVVGSPRPVLNVVEVTTPAEPSLSSPTRRRGTGYSALSPSQNSSPSVTTILFA